MSQEQQHPTGERLTSLEGGQQTLFKSLERMEGKLNAALEHFSTAIDSLRRDFATQSQANWPLVISLVGLVLAVGGGVVGNVMIDVYANSNEIADLREMLIEDIKAGEYERGRMDALCRGMLKGSC